MKRIWQAVVAMGLSSAVTLLLSALQAKIVAIQLGAAGVGVLGIVITSVLVASTALGFGLGSSGVRSVAAASAGNDVTQRNAISAALIRGSWALAAAASLVVGLAWLWWGAALVSQVPTSVLAPWVGLTVGATVVAAGNHGLLNGLGRIYALGTSTALGATVGTLVVVLAMWYSDRWGLIAAFAATPTATLVVSSVMVRSEYPRVRIRRSVWAPELRTMLVLGLAMSSSIILTTAAQLIARVWVNKELGIVNAGYLQGCLAIAAAYLVFLLNALAAEYYPRMAALHQDIGTSNRSVDNQIRIVLALGTPAIVWMIAVAPWLLRLLYNEDFVVASTLLRLLLIGDVFKLVGWCIGFLLLAREAKIKFFVTELSWSVFFLAILLPGVHMGLNMAGVAYALAYALYMVVAVVLGARETGFAMTNGSKLAVAWAAVAVSGTFLAVNLGPGVALPVTLAVALVITGVALIKLYRWSRVPTG